MSFKWHWGHWATPPLCITSKQGSSLLKTLSLFLQQWNLVAFVLAGKTCGVSSLLTLQSTFFLPAPSGLHLQLTDTTFLAPSWTLWVHGQHQLTPQTQFPLSLHRQSSCCTKQLQVLSSTCPAMWPVSPGGGQSCFSQLSHADIGASPQGSSAPS